MKQLILTCSLLWCYSVVAQKATKLRVGERIPFSKVSLFNTEDKVVNLDLPDGKNVTDRFVLVYFYSSNSTVKQLIAFNDEIERILNKYQNNACKGASDIEYATICVEPDFKKWQNILNEVHSNKTKFSGKKTNYLTKGDIKDKTLSAFKVTEYPTIFLVNPKGRLYLETNSFEVLENTFQNVCKVNAAYSTADISGKILGGEKSKSPLTEHKVYLIKSNIDTLKTTATDNFGDFIFKHIDTTQNLSIRIEQTSKVKASPKVFLAKQTGEIVSEFKKNAITGDFEYRLLNVDVIKLTELEDDDDITMKYKKFNSTGKKDFTVNENVYYELGKYNILTESEIVLDKVLIILNANPSVQLQVISHTDAQGDDASNLKLSQNRSNAVIDYLISKGIPKENLNAIGKGETEIRNHCANGILCSDKEQEYNRRTEFKFIKN